MTEYNIRCTEKERAAILHCLARVDAIIGINYDSTTSKREKQKCKADSEFLIALWHKIKNTEPAQPLK